METLLNQQELYFTPLSGIFDVERVAEAIKSIGLSVRDEFVPSLFLIFLDEESREVYRMRRRSGIRGARGDADGDEARGCGARGDARWRACRGGVGGTARRWADVAGKELLCVPASE